MTFFTYTKDIPDGPNNPSVDQPNMKTNTNSIKDILAIDHFTFEDNQGGYHNIIHQPAQLADPAPIPTVGETYTKSVTPTGGVADIQLFYESALGVISQLTGPNAAVALPFGYTWLAGGILLQWGSVTFSGNADHKTGTVLFTTANINFPNACFVVIPGPSIADSTITTASNTTSIRDFTKLQFRWVYNSSSSSSSGQNDGFYWIAIGN